MVYISPDAFLRFLLVNDIYFETSDSINFNFEEVYYVFPIVDGLGNT